jgi:hypothetical protein
MRLVRERLASYGWFPAFDGKSSPAKLFVFRKV